MRVGMICPYSLSVPGGVQEQVLGLAPVLRARGVDVRVLAPCDGPPPDSGITTLGASLPTAANGSIAPIAPDLPAQIRLIKALWNEEFDVLHIHEPLAPGIGITSVLMQAAPMVGTFHAAGRSSAYRWVNRGCRALRSRLAIACAVSAEAEALATKWLGGNYERVFNGI
ncbi:MAG: glycosyltransferase family 4 protein, partial [Acidimicrobiales bacterium]|nr:glycosyltransferase family 4 protein [Acidimicrobiales bacterium]